jgi:hypothetical protein
VCDRRDSARHTEAISEAHYRQTTEEHFRRAAQNPAQQAPARSGMERNTNTDTIQEPLAMQVVASSCDIVQFCTVHREGVEPSSRAS